MKGEWIPTRFNTGGVRVFFSVRSLKNKLGGRMNENHQNGRDIPKMVHQQHGCTTQLQHSAKSSGCKFVLGGRGGHYQQLWGHGRAVPRFLSTAGLTMRVGGVWAREPKLQQSPRFQPILRQSFGETNNLPCQRYLSPPYVLLNQGGKVHSIDRVGEVLLVHLFGNACKK